ncbi:MAG: amidase family protein, partial [Acidimicrobiales bacterium]
MFRPDPLDALAVADIAADLATRRRTSVSLVEHSLGRIELLDGSFGAIRSVVGDCREQARLSDRQRSAGTPRSGLEGIPIVVKDNIDIAGMPTTAGALALEHSVPMRDATIVVRLRHAGAVMVAKANLTEMANFVTEGMPSGYSALGGQVLNPYDTTETPGGSSSGSGVAVALGMAPLALGTETDGSIVSPCQHQSLVGVKPTLGLVSRTGILPIAPSQDTAGPMARTVADAALLLGAIAGPDPEDAATADALETSARLASLVLDPEALGGARIGVVRRFEEGHEQGGQACYDRALEALATTGARLVDVELPALHKEDELCVLHHEFAPALDAYLANLGPQAPIRSLAELREWNLGHVDEALKFAQSHVDASVGIDHVAESAPYREARRRDVTTVTAALEEALGDHLEAIVFPGITGCSFAARAGWPAIVLPAGYAASHR